MQSQGANEHADKTDFTKNLRSSLEGVDDFLRVSAWLPADATSKAIKICICIALRLFIHD